MRAAAILGPYTDRQHLRPFQAPGVELVTVADLPAGGGFDVALVLGGDGSVHRQLGAAVASQVPILCVPTGSGNDFARALGIRTTRDGINAWEAFCRTKDNIRAVDVAEIRSRQPGAAAATRLSGGSYGCPGKAPGPTSQDSQQQTRNSLYCCVAGMGLDSEVNRRANRLPSWLRGHGGYVLSLAPALAGFRAPRISAELFQSDGPARMAGPAMLLALANAPSYGHGMRIAPRAQLDDGRLDVCFVRQTSKLRLLRLFPTVFFGRHLRIPEVVYAQCSGLRIESEPPLDIFADGEFIARTPAEIRICPRALRVIA